MGQRYGSTSVLEWICTKGQVGEGISDISDRKQLEELVRLRVYV